MMVPDLLVRVSQGEGSAHAELAQRIWNRDISDAQVLDLLTSPDDQIRLAASWAVADAARPPDALAHLIAVGVSDPFDAVRKWALFAAIAPNRIRPGQIARFLEPYRLDPSPLIRSFVRSSYVADRIAGVERWSQFRAHPSQ
jgi:hypothetical protein